MSNYPMVDEVNRLVGNLLAAGSGVFLPGVGSLFVERRGARRLSKRSVQPPCRVVSFSSQQQGVSLADELARTLHCDAAGAQDVYDRWLSRTREGDVLTIEGVGVLKFKYFPLDWAGICMTLSILFISCNRAHSQDKLLQKWIFRRLGKFFQSADFFKRTGKIFPHIVRNDLPLQLRNLKLLRPHQNLAAIL